MISISDLVVGLSHTYFTANLRFCCMTFLCISKCFFNHIFWWILSWKISISEIGGWTISYIFHYQFKISLISARFISSSSPDSAGFLHNLSELGTFYFFFQKLPNTSNWHFSGLNTITFLFTFFWLLFIHFFHIY